MTDYQAAADLIRGRTAIDPKVGLILGTGLGEIAETVQDSVVIPYADIPGFPHSGVAGHAGRMVVGRLEGRPVVVLQGRAHYYEGYSMDQVTFAVRVLQVLGIEILIVTNAAGGINGSFVAGDIMLITDHINLIGMGGANPLRGPNLDALGPRFPDMSVAYDEKLRSLARRVAQKAEIVLQEGVYVCLAGPSFETPADLRFLRVIGADAVGMSTVPEVIAARHGGTRVLGFSGITNMTPVDGAMSASTNHEEVLEVGRMLAPKMVAVIRGVLSGL
ncbi:MAG: purine-nucleoside phosphorylase [Chloroflexi bacterium]|nr:purine-nucleoside phosphorylase [Chloroflexota bacterium]